MDNGVVLGSDIVRGRSVSEKISVEEEGSLIAVYLDSIAIDAVEC